MRTNYLSLLFVGACLIFSSALSQSTQNRIKKFFQEEQSEIKISKSDLENWTITSEHKSESLGLTYAYIRQQHEGIDVHNAVANFVYNDDVIYMGGFSFENDLSSRINTTSPIITQEQAILSAAIQLDVDIKHEKIEFLRKDKNRSIYSADGISLENIKVQLMYLPTKTNEIRLVWDLDIYQFDKQHWWSVRIDAVTSDLLDKNDWVTSCNYEVCDHSQHANKKAAVNNIKTNEVVMLPALPPSTDQYNVFAIPVESPSHGGRTLVVGPSDALASPYGWHDDNGSAGPEYTITRGNNVRATEDMNDNNGTGYFPDGGALLNFDFPLNLNQAPSNYLDPAITNLFYMNNIMHDVWYRYGFDEAAGNFQENNYGNGGSASDYVYAEAQDGGGTNNANFATPVDGDNPRMQMYIWDPNIQELLTVNSPAGVAGTYSSLEAMFGPPVPGTPITADLVLFDDNSGVDVNDACENAVNGAAMNGKIAVIMRGDCNFTDKVVRAESEGALGVIMINNVAPGIITMGGTDPGIGIPSVMISNSDGMALLAEMASGTVNGTLVNNGTYSKDGDLDNGIIAHEYGHGISTRLTGGANNSGCLNNDEQMGEGWSDWFGLVLTMEAGDVSTDNRGVGTYVTGEGTDGVGIRNAPYNTDFAINDFTYDDSNDGANVSQPHGIGFVWCTMLWDMTWALIDKYGYDPDVYGGIGGNNIAMSLVIQGLKLQPCNPGFVDGRDAILQADQLLYGGVNQCLIWNAFANRGLGYSADQGSSNSRTDQTEAFDLPPSMVNSSGSANVSSCSSYTWASNGQTYTNSGSYSTTLTNAVGCDSIATLNLTINAPTSGSESISSCNSYTWPTNGNTYTSTGAYTATLTNAVGCDSIVTLNLTINNDLTATQDVSACSDYTWPANGNTYNTTGSYTALLTSAAGCDSLVTLNLTMTTTASSSENVSACGSYTWPADGNTYSSNGSYNVTLLSSTGCDSIVTLNLTINSPTSGSGSVTQCGSYTWPANGNTYTSTGMYTATLPNAAGCDSTATLDLTILTSTAPSTQTIVECDQYTWPADGITYTSTGLYNVTLTNGEGCDSLVTLDLTIGTSNSGSENVTACGSYTWSANGNTYSANGNYTATLTNASGCDSTATLNLTINNVSTSIGYIGATTLFASQAGATYQWLDCDNAYAVVPGETGQQFSPAANGNYAVEVTLNGCTDTSACRVIDELGVLENDFGNNLIVYPNPTFGNVSVSLGESYENISATLFDMNGKLIKVTEVKLSNSFDMLIDGAPGYYIMEIAANGLKAKIRILKE